MDWLQSLDLWFEMHFRYQGGSGVGTKERNPLSQNLIYIGRSRRHASRARKALIPLCSTT